MNSPEAWQETNAFEALSRVISDPKQRATLAQDLHRLVISEKGRTTILECANLLEELAAKMKAAASTPAKRGRPKDHALERDRLWQALEYHDLLIQGVPPKKAIEIVLGKREDVMFSHPQRRSRSVPSFRRDMRARWKQVSKLLDLVTATPEQIAALRQELDNNLLPGSARRRK